MKPEELVRIKAAAEADTLLFAATYMERIAQLTHGRRAAEIKASYYADAHVLRTRAVAIRERGRGTV